VLAGLTLVAASPVAAPADARRLLLVVVIGALVSVVSLVDDVWALNAPVRLLVHLGAAAAVVFGIGSVATIDAGALGSATLPGVVAPWLTVLWVAWFINAFNFMDGSDGIAGVQAAIAALSWILFGWIGGSATLIWCGALLLGSTAGFLVHNWSPARIFMGDAGSALLGFLLATVPWVMGTDRLWLPTVLVLWPFLFDTLFTLGRRAVRGERLWEAHRSHLYQRLIVGGWSHRAVALLYAGLASLGLLGGWALMTAQSWLAVSTAVLMTMAACALWVAARAAACLSTAR
jgi:UDP-N-acetylmuramyl pentapeptide phosphotransferase/UDP-N-acetylglucosamine-1-phosphate transferase